MHVIRPVLATASVLALLPLVVGFRSCQPEPDSTWFFTCGDPVCRGYTGPFDGVPICTDEIVGDACTEMDALCDPEDSCNAKLICATEDPTAGEGGCPISRRKYKHDIQYLDAAQSRSVAATALNMKLSTWRYNWDPPEAPAHLGFVIDDAEGSYAVTADGDHVDLYGYTSLALAAAQYQDRQLKDHAAQIATQRAQIAALEARLAALERGPGR